MPKINKDQIKEILKHSNWIERKYSTQALTDALRAWRYAYKNRDSIDLKYILTIHELLMRELRPDIAGKLRECDVYIDGVRKAFISTILLKEDLNKWLDNFNYLQGGNEESVKTAHIKFEGIHGFVDCNGRTGRILYNIHRINAGFKLHLIKGPKAGQPNTEEQNKYYGWFKEDQIIDYLKNNI